VLRVLLACNAGVASLFLFLSLREDFDQNLLQDVETFKDAHEGAKRGVSLHSSHPTRGTTNRPFHRSMAPQVHSLSKCVFCKIRKLGGPLARTKACTIQVRPPCGFQMAPESGSQQRLSRRRPARRSRVAYSEEGLWVSWVNSGVLLLGFRCLCLLRFRGYALCTESTGAHRFMATQAKRISAERLGDRLSIENPEMN